MYTYIYTPIYTLYIHCICSTDIYIYTVSKSINLSISIPSDKMLSQEQTLVDAQVVANGHISCA